MSREIITVPKIKAYSLDRADYFLSLVRAAYDCGILSDADLEHLESCCAEHFGKLAGLYTHHESSTMPNETAQKLFASLLYTIGMALRSYTSPDEAALCLKEPDFDRLRYDGRRRIETKLKAYRIVYHSLDNYIPPTDNKTFAETINSLEQLPRRYNIDYAAHETGAPLDYPLAFPIKNAVGIDYACDYIERLRWECLALSAFEAGDIRHFSSISRFDNSINLLRLICEAVPENDYRCAMSALSQKHPRAAEYAMRLILQR